jgi:hypothetical protein
MCAPREFLDSDPREEFFDAMAEVEAALHADAAEWAKHVA